MSWRHCHAEYLDQPYGMGIFQERLAKPPRLADLGENALDDGSHESRSLLELPAIIVGRLDILADRIIAHRKQHLGDEIARRAEVAGGGNEDGRFCCQEIASGGRDRRLSPLCMRL